MEDFELLCRLGGGTFAEVYKYVETKTGEFVAIKILKKKYSNWEECIELAETKSLKKLQDEKINRQKGIENIIKLRQMIFIKETGTLNLVFEYMDKDLYVLMKELMQNNNKRLSENQIRSIVYQTLLGLSFMHKYGFFHRDLKPENILIGGEKAKIADFGLAREIRSMPPYTEYVSTRYYRAPECILKTTNYNSPVDIWALGCIMAEMYLHPDPLFKGNNEKEVLYKICSVLGTPNHTEWAEGIQQAKKYEIKFPTCQSTPLAQIIPSASVEAIDLMYKMLNWDPNKRETANNLLTHPFFTNHINVVNMSLSLSTPDLSPLQEGMSNLNINNNQREEKFKPGNNNKLTIDIKNEFTTTRKRDEEINFSLLNDTEGFDNLFCKWKREKEEYDLEMYNKNFCSPVNGDKDFEFDPFKDTGPVMTQNTLFLGSSACFRESSIMNKNLTQLTGINGQGKNDTLCDFSNGQKFFDNSIINNINGLTMTSMIPNSGENILTNSSLDNLNNIGNGDKKEGNNSSDNCIFGDTTQIIPKIEDNVSQEKDNEKDKEKELEKETPIDNCVNVPNTNNKITKSDVPLNNNNKRIPPPIRTNEENNNINIPLNQKEPNIINLPQKDTIPYANNNNNNINNKPSNGRFQYNNNNYHNNNNANVNNNYQQQIKPEFQSRRGKKNNIPNDSHNNKEKDTKEDHSKPNPSIHLSKLLENDMVIGNMPYNYKKNSQNGGFQFIIDSRRGHNVQNSKGGPPINLKKTNK